MAGKINCMRLFGGKKNYEADESYLYVYIFVLPLQFSLHYTTARFYQAYRCADDGPSRRIFSLWVLMRRVAAAVRLFKKHRRSLMQLQFSGSCR